MNQDELTLAWLLFGVASVAVGIPMIVCYFFLCGRVRDIREILLKAHDLNYETEVVKTERSGNNFKRVLKKVQKDS